VLREECDFFHRRIPYSTDRAVNRLCDERLRYAAGDTFVLVGRARDDAITLLSHSDVVPAVRDDWAVDPFGAEIRDGYLHGRGTLDLKGLAIAQLFALILLRRLSVPLRRDVRLLVLADEESGGEYGAK
jgi:acetylornithine deacetylase/succinyl-diaminopimelate desuccinylase-like protein